MHSVLLLITGLVLVVSDRIIGSIAPSYVVANATVNRVVTVFQAVDESFFPLWVNWWAVTLSLDLMPSHWKLHVACMGDRVADLVSAMHGPGCSNVLAGSEHKSKIFRVKWRAITDALRRGEDLMVFDLDAILIRSPLEIFSSLTGSVGRSAAVVASRSAKRFDITSSRDHGPEYLQHAETWGSIRLCVGFMHLRYSPALLEVVQAVYKRVVAYGDDQV